MFQYLFIAVYILLTTGGLVLMKLGNNAGTIAIQNSTVNFSVNAISLVGLIIYIISFLMFTKIITTYDLSYIYPIVAGITQVLSLIAALLIFKEHITWLGVAGIVLVVAGIVVMNINR
ncbi:MAG: SMR family transporter [Oscillospiraceae bacterium]|nr:SMR family transporter [Oscillospiraceae bacterium]